MCRQSSFDNTFCLKNNARSAEWQQSCDNRKERNIGCNIGNIADKILVESPFQKGTLDYKKLKISLLLNALNSLRTKGKLDANVQTILLWKLPKSMSSYVRILLTKFYTGVKYAIIECYKSVDINNDVIDKLLQNSNEEQTQYEDWD